jgi:5-hmdU DNA kinase-like protein
MPPPRTLTDPRTRTATTFRSTPPPCTEIKVAGRRLSPTAVFDTYWRFAARRQDLYLARARAAPKPWTDDPILATYRFTNCYRASDRVSQFGIRHVAYTGDHDATDLIFRILLFKFFNKISTWQLLENALGPITWTRWQPHAARSVLDSAWRQGQRLYTAAYMIPPPRLGGARKHHDHLLLAETMMHDGLATRLEQAPSLAGAFALLRAYPGLGDFLAYQFTIDLNYTTILNFSESQYVVPGPGARDGIRKCFGLAAEGIEHDIIAYVADTQGDHFTRLGLDFAALGGRPLQLIDCQNLFCEVDKYARIAHPEIPGITGRNRIKQHYREDTSPIPTPWFPPKWGINDTVTQQLTVSRSSTIQT